MNRFTYTAPKLDTRFASAIGDGFANAGAAAINYDTKMRNDQLLKNKQALAQSKFDTEVQNNNNILGGYANIGVSQYPELASKYGYDPASPNIQTQNKLGNAVKAKMEFDKARPKAETLEGVDFQWKMNNATGQYEKTNVPVYRDPTAGMTPFQKNMAAAGVQRGSEEWNNNLNTYNRKQQMILSRDEFGLPVYTFPPANPNAPAVGRNPNPAPQNNSNLTPAQSAVAMDNEKKKLALDAEDQARKDEIVTIEGSIENADKAISQIDALINNKSLPYATGILSMTGKIDGTAMKDIHAQIETIKAGAFMSAITQMKGMGALSDAEGKKVADSIANLDVGQSTEQLIQQLNYIKGVLTRSKIAASKKLNIRGVQSEKPEVIDAEAYMKELKRTGIIK